MDRQTLRKKTVKETRTLTYFQCGRWCRSIRGGAGRRGALSAWNSSHLLLSPALAFVRWRSTIGYLYSSRARGRNISFFKKKNKKQNGLPCSILSSPQCMACIEWHFACATILCLMMLFSIWHIHSAVVSSGRKYSLRTLISVHLDWSACTARLQDIVPNRILCL